MSTTHSKQANLNHSLLCKAANNEPTLQSLNQSQSNITMRAQQNFITQAANKKQSQNNALYQS